MKTSRDVQCKCNKTYSAYLYDVCKNETSAIFYYRFRYRPYRFCKKNLNNTDIFLFYSVKNKIFKSHPILTADRFVDILKMAEWKDDKFLSVIIRLTKSDWQSKNMGVFKCMIKPCTQGTAVLQSFIKDLYDQQAACRLTDLKLILM